MALDIAGFPAGFRHGFVNIAFRFGVEQAAKFRACDDSNHSLTNSACSAVTPIQMVAWDHISQLCRRCCKQGRDWALFKADREADYKLLSIAPKEQAYAAIAPRRPTVGKRFGFFSRTLMFGAAAAVLHYNVFSRLIPALVCRLLGIRLICFFDDFAGLLTKLLPTKACAVFTELCARLGIRLASGK